MNAGIYLRTSQGDTSEEQRATIMQRVTQDGASVAAKHEVTHKRVTGGKASADRLAPLVAAVRDGEIATIYVHDFSRFSREGAWGAVATLGEIVQAGGRVVGVVDGFDSEMPGAAVVAAAQADAARAYLETARARSAAAHDRCADANKFPGMPGFGRMKDADGVVVTHPTNGALVTQAFDAAARGATRTEVACILNQNADGIVFTSQAAHSLLARESYWSGILTKGTKRDGTPRNFTCDPLTDRETFLAANAPRLRSVDKRTNGTYLLGGGICRCAGCGYTLSRKDGVTKCVNGRSRGCKAPALIDSDVLERTVADAVVRPYRNAEIPVPLTRDDTPALRAALDRADAMLADVRSPDMQEAFDSAAQWKEAIAERKAARDAAKTALAKAEAETRGRERGTTTVAAAEWDAASLADRISFVRRDLDLVSVDADGRVTLWHPGTLPADLPTQGKRTRAAVPQPLRGIGMIDPDTGVRWIFAAAQDDAPDTLTVPLGVTAMDDARAKRRAS